MAPSLSVEELIDSYNNNGTALTSATTELIDIFTREEKIDIMAKDHLQTVCTALISTMRDWVSNEENSLLSYPLIDTVVELVQVVSELKIRGGDSFAGVVMLLNDAYLQLSEIHRLSLEMAFLHLVRRDPVTFNILVAHPVFQRLHRAIETDSRVNLRNADECGAYLNSLILTDDYTASLLLTELVPLLRTMVVRGPSCFSRLLRESILAPPVVRRAVLAIILDDFLPCETVNVSDVRKLSSIFRGTYSAAGSPKGELEIFFDAIVKGSFYGVPHLRRACREFVCHFIEKGKRKEEDCMMRLLNQHVWRCLGVRNPRIRSAAAEYLSRIALIMSNEQSANPEFKLQQITRTKEAYIRLLADDYHVNRCLACLGISSFIVAFGRGERERMVDAELDALVSFIGTISTRDAVASVRRKALAALKTILEVPLFVMDAIRKSLPIAFRQGLNDPSMSVRRGAFELLAEAAKIPDLNVHTMIPLENLLDFVLSETPANITYVYTVFNRWLFKDGFDADHLQSLLTTYFLKNPIASVYICNQVPTRLPEYTWLFFKLLFSVAYRFLCEKRRQRTAADLESTETRQKRYWDSGCAFLVAAGRVISNLDPNSETILQNMQKYKIEQALNSTKLNKFFDVIGEKELASWKTSTVTQITMGALYNLIVISQFAQDTEGSFIHSVLTKTGPIAGAPLLNFLVKKGSFDEVLQFFDSIVEADTPQAFSALLSTILQNASIGQFFFGVNSEGVLANPENLSDAYRIASETGQQKMLNTLEQLTNTMIDVLDQCNTGGVALMDATCDLLEQLLFATATLVHIHYSGEERDVLPDERHHLFPILWKRIIQYDEIPNYVEIVERCAPIGPFVARYMRHTRFPLQQKRRKLTARIQEKLLPERLFPKFKHFDTSNIVLEAFRNIFNCELDLIAMAAIRSENPKTILTFGLTFFRHFPRIVRGLADTACKVVSSFFNGIAEPSHDQVTSVSSICLEASKLLDRSPSKPLLTFARVILTQYPNVLRVLALEFGDVTLNGDIYRALLKHASLSPEGKRHLDSMAPAEHDKQRSSTKRRERTAAVAEHEYTISPSPSQIEPFAVKEAVDEVLETSTSPAALNRTELPGLGNTQTIPLSLHATFIELLADETLEQAKRRFVDIIAANIASNPTQNRTRKRTRHRRSTRTGLRQRSHFVDEFVRDFPIYTALCDFFNIHSLESLSLTDFTLLFREFCTERNYSYSEDEFDFLLEVLTERLSERMRHDLDM